MPTIFSRIVSGDIPCYKVYEDDNFLAFLDINPLVIGHTLVVPKREVDYIFDLPADELASMVVFSQKVAKHLGSVIECKRIGVTVMGLEVPHAHIHLIPMNSESDMNFSKAKLELSPEEFSKILEVVRMK